MNMLAEPLLPDLAAFVPREVGEITNPQTGLPRIAKDPRATATIEAVLG